MDTIQHILYVLLIILPVALTQYCMDDKHSESASSLAKKDEIAKMLKTIKLTGNPMDADYYIDILRGDNIHIDFRLM